MFDLNDPNATVTLESLSHQRTVIGLESAGLSQAMSAAVNKLPHFLEDVKKFITSRLNPFSSNITLVDSRKLEARFRTIDYVSASNLGVFVPAGFNGNWLDYIQVLNKSQKVLDNLRDGLLKPFEVYVAQLLNSPEHLRDNSIMPQLARYKSPDFKGLDKEFSTFFNKTQSTESTYGEVVKRHADLPLITRDLNEVNTRFASIDRTVLIKQVTSISDLLGMLINNIKESREEYVVSGTTMKALTDLTFFMAHEVEYYTTHGYFLDTFSLSVKDSYKRLERSVER
jgi:hypothetical protein